MKEQKRKISPINEINKTKKVKDSKEKILNKEKKDENNDSLEKVVSKKRGPKSGFLNDMVNNRVKKIFSESNIPCKFENGSITFLNHSNNSNNNSDNTNSISNNSSNKNNIIENKNNMKNDNINLKNEKIKSLINNINKETLNSNIINGKTKNEKNVKDVNFDNLSTYYLKILQFVDEKKEDNFYKSHEVVSFDEMKSLDISTDFNFTDTNEVKISDQKLIEYTSELCPNIVHLDFQLLTDFFNYAHTYSPIINPTALVLRIRKKKLSPGLLLAIYALTYLFHPKQNVKLAKFYAEKSSQYLLAHINASDIQNIHTAYLLSNFEPGTNKSYLFSGITIRLLKVLNLYEGPKNYMEPILYEERVKTIWCCLGKDALMNITCNFIGHSEWMDQPLPQSATDLSVLQYYTPERLTVVFMAAVTCLNKVIQHVKKRRNNNLDKNEFKILIDELNLIHKHLNKHISLSKKSVTTNTHPQLSCIIYHYTMYFTTKIILFNIELSPFIYQNKLSPLKKYIQVKRNSLNIISSSDKYNKGENEGKISINTENINNTNIMTPDSLASSTSSNFNNDNNNNNKNNYNNDNINSSADSRELLSLQSEGVSNKRINGNFNLISANSLSNSESFEKIVDSSLDCEYHNKCILSKLTTPSYKYVLYNEKYNSKKNNDEAVFLEIPSTYKQNIDYESCFNVCFETAEKATNAINILYNTFDKSNIKYQNSFCWFFYHIGLFYMNVYANFKRIDVKEKIEFYHSQIDTIYRIYPFISAHYSKLYEEAKNEAYEAFLDDSIIFCPQGYF